MHKYDYSPELKKPTSIGNISFEGSVSGRLMKLSFKIMNLQAKKYKVPEGLQKKILYIPTFDGSTIPCYMIGPEKTQADIPAIVYYHGGGFFGPLQTMMIQNAVYYSQQLKCNVFLPEYRLTPRFPFPVPLEDCYSTLQYIAGHANELSVDKNNIIIYWDSAGGCLAASTAHLSRDRKGPKAVGQMLIYPVTDNSMNFESMKKYKDAVWTVCANRQMWDMYLRNGIQGMGKYAVPLNSDDFSNLPEAYIEPQELDCLCDEAVAYSKKLEEAGIKTEINIIKASYHGFDADNSSPLVKRVLAYRVNIMRRMFNTQGI